MKSEKTAECVHSREVETLISLGYIKDLKGRVIFSMMEGLCIPAKWGHMWANVKCIDIGNFHKYHSSSPSLCSSVADRYNVHVCILGGEVG